VYLEGIPTVESYVTRAGEPMAELKLHVTRLELLGKPNEESQRQDDTTSEAVADDLPF
jgi:single-strand DNA-binding protein